MSKAARPKGVSGLPVWRLLNSPIRDQGECRDEPAQPNRNRRFDFGMNSMTGSVLSFRSRQIKKAAVFI